MAFLRPLPVRSLHGIGRVTEENLVRAGLRTVGDLQDHPGDLRALVGSWGPELKRFAFGQDARPLDLGEEIKSISSENTFLRDTDDRPALRAYLWEQAQELAGKLARHRRNWADEQVTFEPLHDLALLERKPGAFDHARPLAGWALPECFLLLRRRLEAERDGDGTREYIRVLRLLEKHPLAQLRPAVEQGLKAGALTRDAIAQFLYPQPDWRLTLFSLAGHPHLQHVKVTVPDVTQYETLLGGGR